MKYIFLFVVCFIAAFAANAQLKLANIFTDDMLLQQQQPIIIWGKGVPGKTVQVAFEKEKKLTIVNTDSSWKISLAKRKASVLPVSLFVYSGKESIAVKNIIIGDIWLCIGQSNMEFPMKREQHFKEELSNSKQPLLRLYNPAYAGKNIFNTSYTDSVIQLLNKDDFYKGTWQNCDSNSLKNMSAVAYYFGKTIADNTKTPVGLINLSIGGAPLETFIDPEMLKIYPYFADKVKGNWIENDALPVWIRERGKQNVGALQNVPSDDMGKDHAYKPGFAFKAGIAPLLNMPIKGVLCYQGESNAQEIARVNEYRRLSAVLVNDYRKKWKQPALPFYYVQLSSIDTVKYKGSLWPQFRDEQRKMLAEIPYSGVAVCSDIGLRDDVHPTNKKDVGLRLAAWALNKTYGKNNLPSGPLPKKAVYKNGVVTISFLYPGEGLQSSDGGMLKGFSLDGKVTVDAAVQKKEVVIRLNKKPQFIYYGWKSFSDGNLVNSVLLPASTFRIKVE